MVKDSESQNVLLKHQNVDRLKLFLQKSISHLPKLCLNVNNMPEIQPLYNLALMEDETAHGFDFESAHLPKFKIFDFEKYCRDIKRSFSLSFLVGRLVGIDISKTSWLEEENEDTFELVEPQQPIDIDSNVCHFQCKDVNVQNILKIGYLTKRTDDLYRILGSEMMEDPREAFQATGHALLCVADLIRTGASQRLIERYLVHAQQYDLLNAIIPSFQTLILVNETEQCCEGSLTQQISKYLMCRDKGRIMVVERQVENVTYAIDHQTGIIITQSITLDWTRKIVQWILEGGRTLYENIWIVVLLSSEQVTNNANELQFVTDLICAACKLTTIINASIRIAFSVEEVSQIVQHVIFTHSNLEENSLPEEYVKTNNGCTIHERILQELPFTNPYAAFHQVRSVNTNFRNSLQNAGSRKNE